MGTPTMISRLHPRSPLGRVLLATAAALWATLLIVAWAPEPGGDTAAAEAPASPSAWLALATVGVIVAAGALHLRRHR